MSSSNQGEWPPSSCGMPDLSELNSKQSLTLILNMVFRGGGPTSPKASALVVNFVRLVDKAVTDYESCRQALIQFIDGPNNLVSPLFTATASCESCLNTMARILKLAKGIRTNKDGPQIDRRRFSVLSTFAGRQIREMRDSLEHIDERISEGKWTSGEPVCLLLKSDRLESYGHTIEYRELAEWLKQLHEISKALTAYRANGETNPIN